ncbi:hypothetical protein CRUP_024779, partial [Coryphaenoides rupestris]
VLSYNLCTVMNIPHDPMALEEHFRDDDLGPVSNQGYMPYLKSFILEKARDNFDVQEFNKMCWTLSYKKKLNTRNLLISNEDAYHVWSIFNFLSEERYPLVIVPEEKLLEAMGTSWNEDRWAEFQLQLGLQRTHGGLSAWELIHMVGKAHFSKGMSLHTVSMGITQSLPDKECRKCLFLLKCADRNFELCASDKKRKQEWIQALQTCVQQTRLGQLSLHREARRRRRELRQRQAAEDEELAEKMKSMQATNESNQREQLEEAATVAALEEERRNQTQTDLKERYLLDLAREKTVVTKKLALATNKTKKWKTKVAQYEGLVRLIQPGDYRLFIYD